MSDTVTLSATDRYLSALVDTLHRAIETERTAIGTASEIVADAFDRDGQLFVFGSGHSHVFAEEAFYRAGGAVRVCPILKPPYMLHEGAQRSTVLERETGHAETVLSGYDIRPGRDVLLVVSNSGTNALPVEVAQLARERGVQVLAITSVAYASAKDGPRLHEIVDLALDNHCPPGDAFVDLGEGLPRVGPGSSVVGLALLDAIVVGALSMQLQRGNRPDVYLSAGMPGALERNAKYAEVFRWRNPHI